MINKIRGKLRQEKRNFLRAARTRFPYPKYWARLVAARAPVSYVTGSNSGLMIPESVAFSPSSEMMAVSNAGNASVTLYRVDEPGPQTYENRPFLTITDQANLEYVHDARFAPSGKFIATVAREGHSLTTYSVGSETRGFDTPEILMSLKGEDHGLYFPASVAIHPSGQVLAVANRMKFGISLFRPTEKNGIFESEPFQTISDEDLKDHNLTAPHGIEFSPDGLHLWAVHSRFWKNPSPQGESAVAVFNCFDDPIQGIEPTPRAVFPSGRAALHAIAIHPSNNIVAIADAKGGVNVFTWNPDQNEVDKVDSISFFLVKEGAKGVGISNDGDYVAATTDLNEVLFFKLL